MNHDRRRDDVRLHRIEQLLHHIIDQNTAVLRILLTVNSDNAEVAAETAKLKASTDAFQAVIAAHQPKEK